MELSGNEKKIQTLFRELKLEDERVHPTFRNVWNSAQARSRVSRRGLRISFALATALFLITLGSLIFWSQQRQRDAESGSSVAIGPTTPNSRTAPVVTNGPNQIVAGGQRDRLQRTRRARNFAAHRRANLDARQSIRREVIAISTWQSPTMVLMQSPADEVLNSLPELNRSAAELNSFLPGARR